jgi:hypothetical protein
VPAQIPVPKARYMCTRVHAPSYAAITLAVRERRRLECPPHMPDLIRFRSGTDGWFVMERAGVAETARWVHLIGNRVLVNREHCGFDRVWRK